jgi:hypothetical protein
MAKWIDDSAKPPSIRILNRNDLLRTRLDRSREHGVGIAESQHHANGSAIERLGAEVLMFRGFICDPEFRSLDRKP